jgi:hypothetical protein
VTVAERVLSPMEEVHERARQIEPQLTAATSLADDLDRDARGYLDACYSLYARQSLSGNNSPQALDTRRVPGGRAFFALWASRSAFAWSEKWQEAGLALGVSTECRQKWTDIEDRSRALSLALQNLEDEARKQRVLPGDLRDLISRHGFDRWDEVLQR